MTFIAKSLTLISTVISAVAKFCPKIEKKGTFLTTHVHEMLQLPRILLV